MKKHLLALVFVFIMAAIIAPSSAFAVDVATSADFAANFAAGGEIKLTADITLDKSITTTKSVLLDLNGHTLDTTPGIWENSVKINVGDKTSAGNLEIKNSVPQTGGILFKSKNDTTLGWKGEGDGAINVFGNCVYTEDRPEIKSTLTINNGVKISSEGYYCTAIWGKGATLNVKGGEIISDQNLDSAPITGNGIHSTVVGQADNGGTIINISGGVLKGGNIKGGLVLYHPQEGTLNITGGELYAYDGIQFKGGALNMSAGIITTTGVKPTGLNDNSNGSVQTGAAISFVSNKNYKGNMKLNLSGTAKLISSASHAIWEDTSIGDKLQTVSVNISGGSFSGTVAGSANTMYFKNRAGISDFAVTGGTYNSDPTTYVKAGYVAMKSGDVYVVTSEKKPVEPVLPPEIKDVVVPVSADKVVIASVDMTLAPASKDEAIKQETEKTAEIITTGGIAQSDLTVNETGKVIVKPEVVEKAIKSVELPKNEVLVTETITPLPVVKATVEYNKVAAITFEVSAQDLKAKKAGDVKLFKVISSTKGAFFDFVGTPASADDKMFALQASDIASNDFLSADAAIETGKSYRLTMFVKDNGDFDLNKDAGTVVDPAQLVETKTQTPSSGGSSSGCNAGFAALALLALVPVVYRRKK